MHPPPPLVTSVVLGLAVAVIVLGESADADDTTGAPGEVLAPTTSRGTPPTPELPAIPTPTTRDEEAFLRELSVIAPPLAQHPQRALQRAHNSCGDVSVSDAVNRFSGANYSLTPEQAERVIAAARATVCRGTG